ncbi:hypothetical protein HPB50_023958 [Hyalomma asiaticum]|uniref:Uncharacterized protein n=1 Tax=Hyalomma asiaticum TaxID=266040 RepID=A0ACB7S5I2_HYAAI|nr:hypothetical protein HPB50_023958 [Hyalomma asiaticum]
MPKITLAPVSPNNSEKMKVNLAFHLFGPQVIRGLYFYKNEKEEEWGDPAPTQACSCGSWWKQ